MIGGLVLGLVIGLAVGVGIGLMLQLAKREAAASAARTADARLVDLQTTHAGTLAELERVRRNDEEREVERARDRTVLEGAFAELSRQALEHSTDSFLKLADQRMRQAEEKASGSLAQMVDPLKETLTKYQEELRILEKERQGAYVGLTTTVTGLRESQEHLQKETRNLVTALRAPQTRGRWGEVQLRRVVEMAGMVDHCDFDEQVSASDEDRRHRPDMVIHLPGEGVVVVDAKVPLEAYLRSTEAEDDETRIAALKDHARQVRAHVDDMAKRQYWKLAAFEGSADQVVVFVPGDHLLSAAFEHDPHLQEYAMDHGVILTTPTVLITLLRAASLGWRQERLAENAREVQQLGTELYERLRKMSDHLGKVQRSLTTTVNAFNEVVGSFEGRVLVTARKFPELGIGNDELAGVEPVELAARIPRAGELPLPGS